MAPGRTEQASIQLHRAKFPALENKVYLNFGGQGVMSQSTLDAVFDAYKFIQTDGPFSAKTLRWIGEECDRTRNALAGEFGGPPDSYALVQNTTEGCNVVLWGIEWQSGDHMVSTDSEHPGVEAAVKNISVRRDVRLTTVALSGLRSDITNEEIVDLFKRAIEPKTRLVVLSHVLWNTGRTLPVREIQDVCREAGVQLLVDGAQSAGVIPLDFSKDDYDFYSFPGHKWIGGPEGLGALYIKLDLVAKLEPTFVGWRSVMYAGENAINTASRFEVATAAFPLMPGLCEALEVHRQWGAQEARFAQILENVSVFKRKLADLEKIDIVTPQSAPSSLLSFSVRGKSTHQQIAAALEARRVMLRTIPLPDCLRVSVHYFATPEDADKLCSALRLEP